MTAVHSLAQGAAQDRMQHALRGEDREEFAELHAAVTSDWGPRDAYERRWVMELVTSMWRQDRLRGLELAVLAAAEQESPPSEATVKKLATFARYGARIDKDIGRALQALRTLRKRPDAWIEELQDGTCEPNQPSPCTSEPDGQPLADLQSPGPGLAAAPMEMSTREPEPRLNRQQRRALAAMRRSRAA